MKIGSLVKIPARIDTQFRDALETTSTQNSHALKEATDAFAVEMLAQLRAVVQARGGAYAAAFSHALAASPLAAYMRRDFSQCLPTELAWGVFGYLSPDDLGALSQVNHRCREWAQERLPPVFQMAMRWKRLPLEKTHLKFEDSRREGRHWGRDVLNANPKNSDQYLLAHEDGIEMSGVENGLLVSRSFHEGTRKDMHRIPCAWLPDGEAYTYVQHHRNVGAVLQLVERGALAPLTLELGLEAVAQLTCSPTHPLLAVASAHCDVVYDYEALRGGRPFSDCMQVLPESSVLQGRGEINWCPSRPWLLSTQQDGQMRVIDCGSDVPQILHTLDVRSRQCVNAVWHATRPVFAMVTDKNINVVNLEGESPRILAIRPYDLFKFPYGGNFGTIYLAWEPSGLDLLAASCSDELVITQIHANSYERMAVSSGYDVNNRGLEWSPSGHVEIKYDQGKLVRVKPVKRPTTP